MGDVGLAWGKNPCFTLCPAGHNRADRCGPMANGAAGLGACVTQRHAQSSADGNYRQPLYQMYRLLIGGDSYDSGV